MSLLDTFDTFAPQMHNFSYCFPFHTLLQPLCACAYAYIHAKTPVWLLAVLYQWKGGVMVLPKLSASSCVFTFLYSASLCERYLMGERCAFLQVCSVTWCLLLLSGTTAYVHTILLYLYYIIMPFPCSYISNFVKMSSKIKFFTISLSVVTNLSLRHLVGNHWIFYNAKQ